MVIGLAYFLIFVPPNSSSSDGGSVFSIFSDDEYITYPYVEKMLTPEKIFTRPGESDHLWGLSLWISFYFFSMLVLLPRRIILGELFFAQRATNIFHIAHVY
jgi:hypothetical protein